MPADSPAAAPAPACGGARALMILTEGGQLVVHDLLHWQPQPLTLPAQELPPITVARLVPTVNAAQQGEVGGSAAVSPRSPGAASAGLPSPSPREPGPLSAASAPAGPAATLPQHALTLDRVRACSRRLAAAPDGGAAQEPSLLEHWPFAGGQPAASLAGEGGARRHPSALYFTGHRDGARWAWREGWEGKAAVGELPLSLAARVPACALHLLPARAASPNPWARGPLLRTCAGRVRVWDATTQVPEMLLTIPAAAGQERLRSVTALEVGCCSAVLYSCAAGS